MTTTPSPHASGSGPPSDELVGRARELAELRSGLEGALAGRGRLFLLMGEPGIGKTRLAEELARDAEGSGATTLWGRCWEGGGAPAYWPWIQAVRSHARETDPADLAEALGPGGPRIARIVPEVRERLPDLPEPADQEGPEQARFLLFDAMASFLREASKARPLVLVLEDLHAADQPSLLLLQFLSREVAGARLLVLGTYRDVEAEPRVRDLLADLASKATPIRLSGLSEEELADFVAGRGGPAASGLVAELHRVTEGNPLFVREVVRTLRAEGRLGAGPATAAALRIPDEIRQAIRRRLEPVSDGAREVLRIGATLGRYFNLTPLRRVAAVDREGLVAILSELVTSGILEEVPDVPGRYSFTHALIRKTMYDDLAPAARASLHSQVGAALEEHYGSAPDPHLAELAHHFIEAAHVGNAEKAVDYAVRAAERAYGQFAWEEASAHYRRALEAMELLDSVDETRRCEVLLALGNAQNRAGDVEEAKETFLRATDTARRLGAPELLAEAALGYGRYTWTSGAVDSTLVNLLGEALNALGSEDSGLRVDTLTRLASELYYSDEAERPAQLGREALDIARRLDDPVALSIAVETMAVATAGPDNARERLEAGTEVIRLAERTGDRERTLVGHSHRADAFLALGEMMAADQELETYSRLAGELQQSAHVWYATVLRATQASVTGRFDEAERLARDALSIGRKGRSEEADEYFAVQMFALHRELGRREGLAELEGTFQDLARRYPTLPAFRAALVMIHCAREQRAEAQRELDGLAARGFERFPRNVAWLAAVTLLAEATAFLGDSRHAEELYELLLPHSRQNVVFDWSIACFGSAARYLGLLAATVGHHHEAAGHFQDALELNAAMGARPFVAHVQREYARTLATRDQPGDHEKALDLLAEALASYNEMGMEAFAAETASLLSGLGAGAEVIGAVVPRGEPSHAVRSSVLRREGEYWSIVYEGDAFRLKDAKGLRYIAELIRHPGAEIYALDLVAGSGAAGPPPRTGRAADPSLEVSGLGDAGALLDAKAKAAYKQRMEELREELEEAESFNDPERAAKAKEEMEFLARELASAVGLGGRDRKAASAAERARVNVTRAIKTAIERIAEHSSALGKHFETTIRTGTFCSYAPDPRVPVGWRL